MNRSLLLKSLRDRFKEDRFYFSKSFSFIEIQGERDVINRIDNPPEQVKAAHWFDDFWIYIRIKFLEDKEKGMKDIPFISICFFQEVNKSLDILFRAEWDNYPIVDDYNHPQPHWHISNIKPTVETLEGLNKGSEAGAFESLLHEHVSALTDIYKMHFAMGGNWFTNGDMCTTLESEAMIVNWISNLLRHVKKEIEYVVEGSK